MSGLWGGQSAQWGSICPNFGTGLRPENMNYVRTAGRPLWGIFQGPGLERSGYSAVNEMLRLAASM